MADNNPLKLYDALRETLQRYIPTTLPISRRYPQLRDEFQAVLSHQDLVKGPYVEALPDFEKGRLLRALLRKNGGFLHDGLEQLPAKLLDRPLHRHQEQALRLACADKANLLVATGTGSGKTETFLYPIAHHLLEDSTAADPGVRVLLIYPMNALANDQLYYRIAPLFGVHLADARITFGRFTSQIRANTPRPEEESRLKGNDKLMRALGNPGRIPANWLLTREEMLKNPPKVLITNYAMLEHLLLLPRNAPLFAHDTLQCIVLDEIHTYSGAQATEVAFLLRKLKNRLNLDCPIQVFGTSASLPEGQTNDQKICQFASSLFGEPVHHVVRGKRIPHARLSEPRSDMFSLDIDTWITIGRALNRMLEQEAVDPIGWRNALEEEGILGRIPNLPDVLSSDGLPAMLERLFAANQEVRKVSAILDQGGVRAFTEVAREVFSTTTDTDAAAALSAVIHLGMLARSDSEGFPLLPGRYHLAVNSIEGMAVRLEATAQEGWGALKALRHYQNDETGLYYPLLVCRKCGQPYVEAFEHAEQLYNRRPILDEGKVERRVFWLGKPPTHCTADEADEGEASPAGQNSEIVYRKVKIDPRTGLLLEPAVTGMVLYEVATVEDKEERTRYLRQCPACGGRAIGTDAEVITRMHPGDEALGSVVVQKVLEALPGSYDMGKPRPMGGRTLLTFSDNRQNAAFFAPYFERTSGDLALRTAIYQVLNKADEPMDLALLTEEVFKFWKKKGQPVLIDENGELRTSLQGMRDRLMGRIAAEFCSPGGRRNSLEALGLVRVSYEGNKLKRLIQTVRSEILERHRDAAEPLTHFLLETMRREKAIGELPDIDMKHLITHNYQVLVVYSF